MRELLKFMTALIIGGLIFYSMGVWNYYSPRERLKRQAPKIATVDRDFTRLLTMLDIYQKNSSARKYPTEERGLRALLAKKPTHSTHPKRWVLAHPATEEKLFDPWGTEYRYRFPGTINSSKPEIISAGPDKQFDTDDDLSSQD